MEYERVKAKTRLSAYACVIAMGSLLWLLVCLRAIHSALGYAIDAAYPGVQDADAQLLYYKAELFRGRVSPEALLEACEEDLQSVALPPHSQETHLECLARALSIGHRRYQYCLGLSHLDLPYKPKKTIAWSENACARHFFAPQTQINARRYNFRHSLNTLGVKALRVLKMAREVAVGHAMKATQWLKGKILAVKSVNKADPPKMKDDEADRRIQARLDIIQSKQKAWNRNATQEAPSWLLPPGYTMNCSTNSTCRLASTSFEPPSIPFTPRSVPQSPTRNSSPLAERVYIAMERSLQAQALGKHLDDTRIVVAYVYVMVAHFAHLFALFTIFVLHVFLSGHSEIETKTLRNYAPAMEAVDNSGFEGLLRALATMHLLELLLHAYPSLLHEFLDSHASYAALLLGTIGGVMLMRFVLPDMGKRESWNLDSLAVRLRKLMRIWSIRDLVPLLKLNFLTLVNSFEYFIGGAVDYMEEVRRKASNAETATELKISSPITTTPTVEAFPTSQPEEIDSGIAFTVENSASSEIKIIQPLGANRSLYEDIQEMRKRIHLEAEDPINKQANTQLEDGDLDTSDSDSVESNSESEDNVSSLEGESSDEQSASGEWAVVDNSSSESE